MKRTSVCGVRVPATSGQLTRGTATKLAKQLSHKLPKPGHEAFLCDRWRLENVDGKFQIRDVWLPHRFDNTPFTLYGTAKTASLHFVGPGHAWERVARKVAREAKLTVQFDSEADQFNAYGNRRALVRLSNLLRPYLVPGTASPASASPA